MPWEGERETLEGILPSNHQTNPEKVRKTFVKNINWRGKDCFKKEKHKKSNLN